MASAMVITEEVLEDTPDRTLVLEHYTRDGVEVGRGLRTDPKAGTPQGNRATLEQRADAALTANANYLALASPTNAQNVAQIARLTRETSTLIRLLLNRLDDTAGT